MSGEVYSWMWGTCQQGWLGTTTNCYYYNYNLSATASALQLLRVLQLLQSLFLGDTRMKAYQIPTLLNELLEI